MILIVRHIVVLICCSYQFYGAEVEDVAARQRHVSDGADVGVLAVVRVVGDGECLAADGQDADVELEVGVEAERAAVAVVPRVGDGVRVAVAVVDSDGAYWRLRYSHAGRSAERVLELQQTIVSLLAPRRFVQSECLQDIIQRARLIV